MGAVRVMYIPVVIAAAFIFLLMAGKIDSFEIDVMGVKAKAGRMAHVSALEKIIKRQAELLKACKGGPVRASE